MITRLRVLKPRQQGDITALAKDMSVSRGTVYRAIMGHTNTDLAMSIREKAINEYRFYKLPY